MAKRIVWSLDADEDLGQVLDYLHHKWSMIIASNFIEKLAHLTNQIARNPEQFPEINKQYQIRKCVITKHNSLFYRDRGNYIEIIRLFDTRQNPDSLKFD